MNRMNETRFTPDWCEPAPHLLRNELPDPPKLLLTELFGEKWAEWILDAAETKSAPPDYVAAGLLAVAGSSIGNARWASPWRGWAEPPILWVAIIGSPSSNKSPALDAILSPLRDIEKDQRACVEIDITAWKNQADVAKLAEAVWKEQARTALKNGGQPPERPATLNPGAEPHRPRLLVTDVTVERLAVILERQPRGLLLARDELAGWLQGMTRYSGGGSDRPFWLEAYGGRGFTVERMGRDPVFVPNLSVGVIGSIQPDRLKSLMLRADDDGLLARFLPFYPNPAPIRRPLPPTTPDLLKPALEFLQSLEMQPDGSGGSRPWLVPFSEAAQSLLEDFRRTARGWEKDIEGMLLSFVGKTPGLVVRVALILAFLDGATRTRCYEPLEIEQPHVDRAILFIESYALPMARRAYCDAVIEQKIARSEAIIKQADKVLSNPNLSPEKRASVERAKKGAEIILANRRQRQQASHSAGQMPDTQPVHISADPPQGNSRGYNFFAEVKNVFFYQSYDNLIDYSKRDNGLWSQAITNIEVYIRYPFPWYLYVFGLFIWGSFAAGIAFEQTPSTAGEFGIFFFSFIFGFWNAADKLAEYKTLLRKEYWRLEDISKSKAEEVESESDHF